MGSKWIDDDHMALLEVVDEGVHVGEVDTTALVITALITGA